MPYEPDSHAADSRNHALAYSLQEQLNAGFDRSEITRSLLDQGHSLEAIQAAFQRHEDAQVDAFKARNPLLSNKYTPLVIIALDYLLFFHLIPDETAHSFPYLFSFLGGGILTVSLLWAVARLTPKLLDKFPIPVGIVSIGMLFVFAVLFINKTGDFSSDDLRKYGVVAMAKVVDRSQIRGRRGHRSYGITVAISTARNSYTRADIPVSQIEYEQFPEGTNLPVIYSAAHPSVATLAYPKTLEQYGKPPLDAANALLR